MLQATWHVCKDCFLTWHVFWYFLIWQLDAKERRPDPFELRTNWSLRPFILKGQQSATSCQEIAHITRPNKENGGVQVSDEPPLNIYWSRFSTSWKRAIRASTSAKCRGESLWRAPNLRPSTRRRPRDHWPDVRAGGQPHAVDVRTSHRIINGYWAGLSIINLTYRWV